MASKAKALFSGTMTTSNAIVYTTPKEKYTIVKSIVINNRTAYAGSFYLQVGTTTISNGHIIKPYGTLMLDDLSIPLLPDQVISIMNMTASNAVLTAYISGEESDYVLEDYRYVTGGGYLTTAYSSLVSLDSNKDHLIKSFVMVNTSSTARTVSFSIGSTVILTNISLGAYDVLVVPLANIVVPAGVIVQALASNNTNILYGITLIKLDQ